MTGRRIVSICLPRFAMERWRMLARRGQEAPDDGPFALVVEGPHGPALHACNRAAEAAGLSPGARLADMRALCPELRVEYADPEGDRAALERLAFWARRWCPWTAVDATAPDGVAGLVLDTTGSAHLLGGEAAMLAEMEARLGVSGLTARLALGPSWGAARALAHHAAGERAICGAGEVAARLAPLPVAALRLDAETVLLLHRLGLRTIGALAGMPRLSLARRFARAEGAGNPLARLDQAMGATPEPVAGPDAPARFEAWANLAEPVQDPAPHLPGLSAALCERLAQAGAGARRLRLCLFRTDGEVATLPVATSRPARDAGHLQRLFDGKLERLDAGFGFDAVLLEATLAEPLEAAQTRLDGRAEEAVAVSRLIDRLSARLGRGAVRRPAPRESHLPERAEGWTEALSDAPARTRGEATGARPARLLATPEEIRVLYAIPDGPPLRFVWRRQTLRVARAAGPERIAPEWWRDRPGTRLRDYFRVEDATGRRLWLYREGLHEDGRGGEPRWFVHGMFA